jgi:dephospho-CoA kinase
MTVIGITGPSGAGKGAVSALLQTKYGFIIIDADSIYHSLVSAPSPCLNEIRQSFGDEVIAYNGALDRKALGQIVFGDEDKLLLLNSITHKYVAEKIIDEIGHCRSRETCCAVDAPLLLEAGLDKHCDFTIAVLADKQTRVQRIISRDNISPEKAEARISSQKNDEFYSLGTDYIIRNDGDISLLEHSLDKILSERRAII